MNKVYTVTDDNGNVVDDVAGFLIKEELEKRYPNNNIVEMKSDKIPERLDCCRVIDGEFVKRSDAEIAVVMKPEKDKEALQNKLKTLKATDADALATVIKILQG